MRKISIFRVAALSVLLMWIAACTGPQQSGANQSTEKAVSTANQTSTTEQSANQLFHESLRALQESKEGSAERFVELTKKAAERGHPDAMNNMGAIYLHGAGSVKPDHDLSISWYERLAKVGERHYATDGHRNAGYLYYQKYKAEKNVAHLNKAVEHLRAADPQDRGAATILAMVLVESGMDPEMGKRELAKFAAEGSLSAREFLERVR